MSLLVKEELRRMQGIEDAPRTILEIVERALEAGVKPEQIVVSRPSQRDPTLFVKNRAVAAWLRIS